MAFWGTRRVDSAGLDAANGDSTRAMRAPCQAGARGECAAGRVPGDSKQEAAIQHSTCDTAHPPSGRITTRRQW
jgi:hypothetical protein